MDGRLNSMDRRTCPITALRDLLGMTGTKFECSSTNPVHSPCRSTASRSGPACLQSGEIDGAITTIEGIGETEEGRGIHSFWLSLEVLQCGYRQCGQIKPLSLFLPATRSPTMRPLTLRCPLFGRFISRRSLAIPRFNCGPGAQPRLCWQMLLSSVRHSST